MKFLVFLFLLVDSFAHKTGFDHTHGNPGGNGNGPPPGNGNGNGNGSVPEIDADGKKLLVALVCCGFIIYKNRLEFKSK